MAINRDNLARAVSEKLKDTATYVDVDIDLVDGSFEEVIEAVIEVLNEHGPVIDGD